MNTQKLLNVATVVMGLSPKGSNVSRDPSVGLPLLNRPTEFGPRNPTAKRWTSATARRAEKGDILFCVRGSTTGRMNRAQEAYAIGRGIAAIRGESQSDTEFIFYALTAGLGHLLAITSGSVFPNLSRADIRDFELEWPVAKVREAKAATLGALDDKIESNRRAISKAQEVGDALFACASSGHRALSDVATIMMGTSPKGETLNELGDGVPFFQGARDYGFRFPSVQIWTTNPIRLTRRNDTLMSVRAPVGELNRAITDCCVGRGVAAINSLAQPSTLYYAMRASRAAWEKFQGEGTVFTSVNKQDVHGTEILWVTDARARSLEQELSSLDEKIEALEIETQLLRKLRDALLPALLSGRVRVPVEGVAT